MRPTDISESRLVFRPRSVEIQAVIASGWIFSSHDHLCNENEYTWKSIVHVAKYIIRQYINILKSKCY